MRWKPWTLTINLMLVPVTAIAASKYESTLQIVRHQTRVKILISNNVSTRPGSVYDNITYFEELSAYTPPGFNYEFVDTGLGTAEPLYPLYQKGHQHSWDQLLKAMWSEKNRHIDHYTSLATPQGCYVEGIYLLRHISEYPETEFVEERKQGYQMVVIRLEHYTKQTADAQCGRHRAHDPDPNFDPKEFLAKNHNAMYLSDFQPQSELQRFEARMSTVYHISEVKGSGKYPRFDREKLKYNDLFYYPDGHEWDYGIKENSFEPRTLVMEGNDLKTPISLKQLLTMEQWTQVMNFIDGRPFEGFDPATEPGGDTLQLDQVTPNNIYTHGLERRPITDVYKDISNMANYQLVGIVNKPEEDQEDVHWQGEKVIPQMRLTYQLLDPEQKGKHTEQLFLHLKYDVVDRDADEATQAMQKAYFLKRLAEANALRDAKSSKYAMELNRFVMEFANLQPIESISFGSALTGIWVFGALTRIYNQARELKPMRINRQGVDLGYYSTIYDNDIFRKLIKTTKDKTLKKNLQSVINDITVSQYRDPKRQNVQALRFNRVSCAQCHQTSGRDGVHFALNDGLDRRVTAVTYPTEFIFRDGLEQLKRLAKP